MEIYGRALDLMFRRIPAERIVKGLEKDCLGLAHTARDYETDDFLLLYSETVFAGFSRDEQELFLQLIRENQETLDRYGIHYPLAFSVLFHLGKKYLDILQDEPVCRYSLLLDWRQIYHMVGQDMLVCAFLAERDLESSRYRFDFGWLPTLNSDNRGLNNMLAEGIAENHSHLNGSTQIFELSWIALMNHPYERIPQIKKMDKSLRGMFIRGAADVTMSLTDKVELAALLRTILFRRIIKDGENEAKSMQYYRNEYLLQLEHGAAVQNTVEELRFAYGAEFDTLDGQKGVLDYALHEKLQRESNSHYRSLMGERWLLYSCFRECLCGKLTDDEQSLLYLYLVLKTAFRGELIQTNQQVGFHNFMEYQDRKDLFWENSIYEWEAYRMAVSGPINNQNIVSLESRLAPKETAEEDANRILKLDRASWFAEEKGIADLEEIPFWKEKMQEWAKKSPGFYTIHFIKTKDDEKSRERELILQCRNQNVRNKLMLESVALARALSRSEYLCARIRGIDACNAELFCRPEVFAQTYRFLSGYQPEMLGFEEGMLKLARPQLGRTYHVGEEFYSIADGLRAIDEALRFLGLRRGDRLGHALALGVQPEIHQNFKSHYAVMPKQNYLDTLVWILYRGMEMNLGMPTKIRAQYRQKAESVLREIFGEAIRENGRSVTLEEYYASMQLRGDRPERYLHMKYEPTPFSINAWDRFDVQKDPELGLLRQDSHIARLYYLYQYGRREKMIGAKPVQVEMDRDELALIKELQERMMDYIRVQGIYIETNPSSNVLIGTFGEYQNHPIFRFNEQYGETNQRHQQLKVCINADDPGVFDTSLTFEYALIYEALDTAYDSDGKKKYDEERIMAYMQQIRQTGIEASWRC